MVLQKVKIESDEEIEFFHFQSFSFLPGFSDRQDEKP